MYRVTALHIDAAVFVRCGVSWLARHLQGGIYPIPLLLQLSIEMFFALCQVAECSGWDHCAGHHLVCTFAWDVGKGGADRVRGLAMVNILRRAPA